MNAQSSFVYVTFIRTTPEKLWAALTEPEFTKQYWTIEHHVSAWEAGADWNTTFADGRIADSGQVIEADPPRRLVLKWRNEFMPELKAEGYGRCTIELEQKNEAVKLTITHESSVPDSKLIKGVSSGWPRILSNLKSLLETGALTYTG